MWQPLCAAELVALALREWWTGRCAGGAGSGGIGGDGGSSGGAFAATCALLASSARHLPTKHGTEVEQCVERIVARHADQLAFEERQRQHRLRAATPISIAFEERHRNDSEKPTAV